MNLPSEEVMTGGGGAQFYKMCLGLDTTDAGFQRTGEAPVTMFALATEFMNSVSTLDSNLTEEAFSRVGEA